MMVERLWRLVLNGVKKISRKEFYIILRPVLFLMDVV